ncbi:MAG: ABC transporter substrate-binding protein [Oscillospiraceae bacterium]|nr:ABC transporter substrate-binding protein [Oscillospiraceae bacterium]
MKRNKILALLLVLLLLTGCATEEPIPEGDPALTFTDNSNFFVTAPSQPRTVAVLCATYAELWTLAGGTVRVTVGEAADQGFASQDATLVDTGDGTTVDQEALLAADPDFVIGSVDVPAHVEACKAAREAGISAALFHMGSFQDYLRVLDIFTMITGDDTAYETYGRQLQQQIDTLKAQATGPRHILSIAVEDGVPVAYGPSDHFLCAALEDLGAENVIETATAVEDLSPASLPAPDHIFLICAGDQEKAQLQALLTQPDWSDLAAIQQGDYTFLEDAPPPNASWPQTYQDLAAILYPAQDQ